MCESIIFDVVSTYLTSQLILNTELARFGTRGFVDGLLNGGVIALPSILNFGTSEQQAKFVPDILAGKKYISLAITEAFAGSDVGGVQTVAVRDGDEWVVTGTKKYASMLHDSSRIHRVVGG